MSQRNRQQAVVRAYANQDAIDLVSDDDWDEYETHLLQGSSSGTKPTPDGRKAETLRKSSPQKRKIEEGVASVSTDSSPRATKRPRRSDGDEPKSGKSGKTLEATVGLRKNPVPIALSEDVDVGDSGLLMNSVVNPARFGPSGRSPSSTKPNKVHVSAALSRSSELSGNKRLSKLDALADVTGVSGTFPPLCAQTGPSRSPAVKKEKGNDEGNAPTAKPTVKSVGRSKLVRPEKKKTKKQLEAEKKALDLREKKMTRREFIQYLHEEKLKEELGSAPTKKLVLKDKVIWYAEPGDAKASDSFDRQRYEMVCFVQQFGSLAYSSSSSFVTEPLSCQTSTIQRLPMSYSQAI
jgi:hypothetical protein